MCGELNGGPLLLYVDILLAVVETVFPILWNL